VEEVVVMVVEFDRLVELVLEILEEHLNLLHQKMGGVMMVEMGQLDLVILAVVEEVLVLLVEMVDLDQQQQLLVEMVEMV
jgi:hypothetical protein